MGGAVSSGQASAHPPLLVGKSEAYFGFPIVILHKLTFIAHSFHEAFIFSPHVRGKS